MRFVSLEFFVCGRTSQRPILIRLIRCDAWSRRMKALKKGEFPPRTRRIRGVALNPNRLSYCHRGRMGVRCNVTASQASFSNMIGEPGHTKPSRSTTPGQRATVVCIGCALLSTLTEGLPTPRKTGNLRFRYSQHWERNRLTPYLGQ